MAKVFLTTGVLSICVLQVVCAGNYTSLPRNPLIRTNDGNLQIDVDDTKHVGVSGSLHVGRDLTLSGLDNTVVDELTHCQDRTQELKDQLSTMKESFEETIQHINESLIATLKDSISNLADKTSSTVNSVEQKIRDLENADDEISDEISTQRAESEKVLRKHIIDQVEQVSEDAADYASEGLKNLTQKIDASFDEVDVRFSAAGLWEYTFSGTAAIKDTFAYWFSIDHGGQGANETDGTHKAGVDDSYNCGNWYIHVEASSGHCGGGCHVDYFEEKAYFNGYCSRNRLAYTSKSQSTGNSYWALDRVADGHNGHSDICHTFKVRHQGGVQSYGGSYRIVVRSSKPLLVLHSYPWGGCAFNNAARQSCGGCKYTVYQSTNCKGHQVPPGACKRGVPAKQRLGLRSDPKDSKFNKNIRNLCCFSPFKC